MTSFLRDDACLRSCADSATANNGRGGTHLKSTAAIGPIVVAKIENTGKINRRIPIAFA